MNRVLISTSSFAAHSRRPLEMLEDAGIDYRTNPHHRRLEKHESIDLLRNCDGVIAGTEVLDREVLTSAAALRVVSRCGTGMENVDLAAARELGITVRNTPDAHVEAVAELTLAGMLTMMRSMVAADRAIREGSWIKPMGRLLRGKTVGLVGLGRVGREVVRLLEPFGVRLLATDPDADSLFASEHAIELLALDDLLPASDVISLHLPLSKETHHLLDRRRLRSLRAGAILINCSRGGLIDEEALHDCLREERIGGAFLDTFESEPYTGPLRQLPNVLLTSHIGSYAAECRERMEVESVRNLLEVLQRSGPQ